MTTKPTAGKWGWQKFGKEWCLVAQVGMRPIVMAVRKGALTSLVNGLLVPFDPTHPDAQLIISSVNAIQSAAERLGLEPLELARRLESGEITINP